MQLVPRYLVSNDTVVVSDDFSANKEYNKVYQRNLKILGIFTRLFKRDGKPQYLRYIPNTWKMINKRLKNPIFNNLRKLIKKNLPIRKLKEI